ncbi:MAG TPA: hypothetical protein VGK20_04960 [Candidatus Binatia bacterium]
MVALNIARCDLRERPAREGFLPITAVAFVVAEGANAALRALHHVVNHVGEQRVASADRFREEAALVNLVLTLRVDLARQRLGAYALAVLAALLVMVAYPPHSAAARTFEDATVIAAAALAFGLAVVVLRHRVTLDRTCVRRD